MPKEVTLILIAIGPQGSGKTRILKVAKDKLGKSCSRCYSLQGRPSDFITKVGHNSGISKISAYIDEEY